jgi:hypothetical protein
MFIEVEGVMFEKEQMDCGPKWCWPKSFKAKSKVQTRQEGTVEWRTLGFEDQIWSVEIVWSGCICF